jgi:methionyl-tRNA formyltransferase
MIMPYRLHFYGTSAFAVPILERLHSDDRFEVTLVVTQPDRPVGRHATLEAPPIKKTALAHGLTNLHQPEKVKSDEFFAYIQTQPADVAVVASFGQIIPDRVLSFYPHGMVNVHASLLPKYRGASPIAAVIREGETKTGVTIMKMDALMDHGPVLSMAELDIRPDDTTPTLEARLATLGAEHLPDILFDYLEGKRLPVEQDHAAATKIKLLTREDGELKPAEHTAEQMERLVRAYSPWPGTFLAVDGKRLKVLKTEVGEASTLAAGSRVNDRQVPAIVGSNGKTLHLLTVQPEGKSAMEGKAFLNGVKNW